MKQLSEITVGFIGFGNMAGAIAKGLIRQGTLRPDQICACAKNWDKLCANTEKAGMLPRKDAAEVAFASDVVFVAVKPYLVSIVYSLGAALLAALVSIVCVRFVQKSKNKLNKLFEYGALIPWLLPSTLIALGLTMAYGDRNPLIFNKVLVGTTVILLIGYVVIKLPFSYRMIRSAFFSVDEDLEDAAKCMGASTFYTMRKVIIPVILPAVLSVVILNFNGLLADYDLTAFLYHPLFQPLGIVVKAASDENASIDAKCMSFVYTVVLMILSSVALYFGQGNGMQAIRRWKQRRIEKKVYRK